MMTRLLSLIAMMVLPILVACTHIDPDKARAITLSQNDMTALKNTVANDFPDPKKVEFRNITARDNLYDDGRVIRSVCGEVRGTGPIGDDVGFIGFTRNLENGKWVVPAIGQPCY